MARAIEGTALRYYGTTMLPIPDSPAIGHGGLIRPNNVDESKISYVAQKWGSGLVIAQIYLLESRKVEEFIVPGNGSGWWLFTHVGVAQNVAEIFNNYEIK